MIRITLFSCNLVGFRGPAVVEENISLPTLVVPVYLSFCLSLRTFLYLLSSSFSLLPSIVSAQTEQSILAYWLIQVIFEVIRYF